PRDGHLGQQRRHRGELRAVYGRADVRDERRVVRVARYGVGQLRRARGDGGERARDEEERDRGEGREDEGSRTGGDPAEGPAEAPLGVSGGATAARARRRGRRYGRWAVRGGHEVSSARRVGVV